MRLIRDGWIRGSVLVHATRLNWAVCGGSIRRKGRDSRRLRAWCHYLRQRDRDLSELLQDEGSLGRLGLLHALKLLNTGVWNWNVELHLGHQDHLLDLEVWLILHGNGRWLAQCLLGSEGLRQALALPPHAYVFHPVRAVAVAVEGFTTTVAATLMLIEAVQTGTTDLAGLKVTLLLGERHSHWRQLRGRVD